MKLLPEIKKIKSVKDIPALKMFGVEIDFTPENENVSPCEQFDDDKIVQEIYDKYNRGNEAAWFCAKVEAKFREMEGTDFLGCCSYNSFEEFQSEESGHYVDMINRCIEEINAQIISYNTETKRNSDIRKAKDLLEPYGLYVVSQLQINPL